MKVMKEILPNQAMTEEASQLLLSIMMDEQNKFDKIIDSNSELINLPNAQLLYNIIKVKMGFNLTLGSAIILANYIEDENDALIYAYYIKHNVDKNTLIDINLICKELFPWGFLSEQQKTEIEKIQNSNTTDWE